MDCETWDWKSPYITKDLWTNATDVSLLPFATPRNTRDIVNGSGRVLEFSLNVDVPISRSLSVYLRLSWRSIVSIRG
jgi:hypothetical protein